ncbi:MAG: DMT family transporter [Methanosarcinaceae archaeon]|nr:DMT family transporter [Methanosarcinaceae archaeon]MDD4497599.1 DMT family transporter [Methanosarcinaceae archaeon]
MPQTFKENHSSSTAIITACILFGTAGIFLKGIKEMEIGSILFYRLFFGLSGILIYLAVIGKLHNLSLKRNKKYLVLLGVLNTITVFSYYSSIKLTSISVAVLLLYTAPIYVILLSPIFLKEKVTLKNLVALTLCFSGIVLVVDPSSLVTVGGQSSSGNSAYLPGLFLGLLSGLSYGFSIITVNYLKEDYSGLSQTFWSTVVSLLLLLPFGLSVSAPVLIENLGVLIPFGLLGTATGSLLYFCGIARIKAQKASVLSLIEPVSSIFFGCTFLGENLYTSTIEGCAFILFGALLVNFKLPFRLEKSFGSGFSSSFRGFPQIYRPRLPPGIGKF